jgi:hypothetical protein
VNGVIIAARCPYCSKPRSPLDFIHQPGGVKICHQCEQRHLEALVALSSGEFKGECSECGLTAVQLQERNRCGPLGQMAVHFEHGKYRAMCLVCDKSYVPKRLDLYGDTDFAHETGLTK